MKNRRRDHPDLLPPFEGSSDSSDDTRVLLEDASITSEERSESMVARRLTQSALNNSLFARISHPTSDFIRSRSSMYSDAEESSFLSCFSSTSGTGDRVSTSSTTPLDRDLTRRTVLVEGERENSILDDSMKTLCSERCLAGRERESSLFALNKCRPMHANPNSLRSSTRVYSIPRLCRRVHSNLSYRSGSTDGVDEPIKVGRPNRVILHIYDLIAKDTLVQFPSPLNCVCEIGKCFNDVNSALHELGTGAYHVGVEVNGVEYAYGATSTPGKTGIFSCIPKLSPGYQYRSSIDFGNVSLKRTSWVAVPPPPQCESPRSSMSTAASFRHVEELVDGRMVIKEMTVDYMGTAYDILRKNCCTFAHDACVRLGVPESQIPSWFSNLAQTGAYSQDLANATFEPFHRVLSTGCGGGDSVIETRQICPLDESEETGFEIVARRNATNTGYIVVVMDADPNRAVVNRMRAASVC